jgi:hypothetical protein
MVGLTTDFEAIGVIHTTERLSLDGTMMIKNVVCLTEEQLETALTGIGSFEVLTGDETLALMQTPPWYEEYK